MYSERPAQLRGAALWQVTAGSPGPAGAMQGRSGPTDDGPTASSASADPMPLAAHEATPTLAATGSASASESASAELVLPDACMDIVWTGGRLVVAGPDTRAHSVEMRAGEVAAGLRLAPGTAPALLGVVAHELRDQRVPLDEVWSARVSRGVAEAVERAAPGGPGAVATAIEGVVLALSPRQQGVSGQMMLTMSARGAEVSEIARETGWSERQLRRHSHELFGYGLATLRRVLRLQAAVRLAGTETSLAAVAGGAGYSDQAHLARDVRALTGTTPTALFAGRMAAG
ncbi:helix-turn-helix domain-containing protein [Sanguibacter sp. 4.1]|uniref:Helix-turn-helix domain-containing protein n=1 Tax=Sanguibacter biliveldensis TaxID=3030830 RepID=A0AAF0ZAN6_9MICO|nr:helix-turn-helix domain-containing protein [Sanguibacter sp. 4.1]WPF83969.1 helix-turn-helix domain-containing protein [Sanguibacter sp. 4.1]